MCSRPTAAVKHWFNDDWSSPDNTGETSKSGMQGVKYLFCESHRLSVGLEHDGKCDRMVANDWIAARRSPWGVRSRIYSPLNPQRLAQVAYSRICVNTDGMNGWMRTHVRKFSQGKKKKSKSMFKNNIGTLLRKYASPSLTKLIKAEKLQILLMKMNVRTLNQELYL